MVYLVTGKLFMFVKHTLLFYSSSFDLCIDGSSSYLNFFKVIL